MAGKTPAPATRFFPNSPSTGSSPPTGGGPGAASSSIVIRPSPVPTSTHAPYLPARNRRQPKLCRRCHRPAEWRAAHSRCNATPAMIVPPGRSGDAAGAYCADDCQRSWEIGGIGSTTRERLPRLVRRRPSENSIPNSRRSSELPWPWTAPQQVDAPNREPRSPVVAGGPSPASPRPVPPHRRHRHWPLPA